MGECNSSEDKSTDNGDIQDNMMRMMAKQIMGVEEIEEERNEKKSGR